MGCFLAQLGHNSQKIIIILIPLNTKIIIELPGNQQRPFNPNLGLNLSPRIEVLSAMKVINDMVIVNPQTYGE